MQTPVLKHASRHADVVPVRAGERAVQSRRRKTLRALAAESGQGTVEYVGLLLLMASVLAAVVVASGSLNGEKQIGQKVVDQVGKSIDTAGDAKAKK